MPATTAPADAHDRADNGVAERMVAAGLRLTRQRRAVAAAFTGVGPRHLSADDLWSRAQLIDPGISRATVYNTVKECVARGLVRSVAIDTGAVRYDPNVSDGHSHAVCDGCGAIIDVYLTDREWVTSGISAGLAESSALDLHGFRTTDIEIILRGQCANCATSE